MANIISKASWVEILLRKRKPIVCNFWKAIIDGKKAGILEKKASFSKVAAGFASSYVLLHSTAVANIVCKASWVDILLCKRKSIVCKFWKAMIDGPKAGILKKKALFSNKVAADFAQQTLHTHTRTSSLPCGIEFIVASQ